MSRSRNIKPGLFQNEDLADLGPYAMILFEGLWCESDRAGRLEDRPRRLKIKVLPYFDDVSAKDVDKLLNSLHKTGFIQRYEVDNNKYIQVVNFDKHQNPHKNEADSTIPAPDEYSTNTVLEPEQHTSDQADSLNLIPDSLNSDSLTSSDGQSPPRVAIHFPLNDKSQFPVLEDQVRKWEGLYPNVDVRQELRKMLGWLDANPTKRKTKTGILKFCNTWLSKQQDKGGNNGPNQPTKPSGFAAGDAIGQRWVDSYTGNG